MNLTGIRKPRGRVPESAYDKVLESAMIPGRVPKTAKMMPFATIVAIRKRSISKFLQS